MSIQTSLNCRNACCVSSPVKRCGASRRATGDRALCSSKRSDIGRARSACPSRRSAARRGNRCRRCAAPADRRTQQGSAVQRRLDRHRRQGSQGRRTDRAGRPGHFRARLSALAGNLAASPAMDDKVGLWTVMEAASTAARQTGQAAIYCVSTVQEKSACVPTTSAAASSDGRRRGRRHRRKRQATTRAWLGGSWWRPGAVSRGQHQSARAGVVAEGGEGEVHRGAGPRRSTCAPAPTPTQSNSAATAWRRGL